MRWARFEKNGQPCYAVIEGDTVIPVRGSPFEAWERTPERLNLADVKLLVPVVPPTFYAAGMNYAQHVIEVAEKLGRKPDLPPNADTGYRTVNALIADGENIVIPADATELVQYEAELVVVIGRKCKNLTRENALSAVLGYTIGNDVSERTWQKSDRTLWRAKNTDTFKPMGPWIETDVKLEDLKTTVRLNGKEMITFDTNKMIHGVVDFLVTMTTCLTLYPGDVVWMGTEGMTENMKHGDTIEVEITGIGTLSNGVVREGQ
jgi:2-keto-4-pentenoate hydratase/2-oxohepta-3-ene-1,7-dioic acid hydratase in catechol pathway